MLRLRLCVKPASRQLGRRAGSNKNVPSGRWDTINKAPCIKNLHTLDNASSIFNQRFAAHFITSCGCRPGRAIRSVKFKDQGYLIPRILH